MAGLPLGPLRIFVQNFTPPTDVNIFIKIEDETSLGKCRKCVQMP